MTYVSLKPEMMQTLIDGLTSYATTALEARDAVVSANTCGDSPTDLISFSDDLGTSCANLEEEAGKLQARLDAAKAANESGITFTGSDGTMSYYIPDGMEDTAENATANNNVEIVNQARADAASLVTYSQDGCDPEQWDALLARVQEHQDDPAYANALLANTTAVQLLDCPKNIQESMTYTSQREGTSRSERPSAAMDLCAALGHVLAAATSTWSESKSTQYANELADATEEKGESDRLNALNGMLLASREADVDQDGSSESVGLDYGDSFLVTLAGRMEGYSPQKWDITSPSDWIHRMTDRPLDNPYVPQAVYSGNALAGVLHAMTGSPRAAQEWLIPPQPGPAAPTPLDGATAEDSVERIKALVGWGEVGDNVWTDDWALLADEISQGQGRPLESPVLLGQSPSPVDGEGGYEDTRAASTVSGILNGIGAGLPDAGSMSGTARGDVADTLARYPEGVDISTKAGDDSGVLHVPMSGGARGAAQPVVDDSALSRLAAQVSQDEAANQRLGEAMIAHHDEKLTSAASTYKASGSQDDLTLLRAAIDDRVGTNGFLTGAANHYDVAQGALADDNARATTATASWLAGLVPVAGSTASYMIGRLGRDSAHNQADAAARAGSAFNAARDANNDQVTLALMNAGLYDQGTLSDLADNSSMAHDYLFRDGSLATSTMTPEQLTDEGVDQALTEAADRLHYPGEGGSDKVIAQRTEDVFEDAYKAAYPGSAAAG